MRKDTDSKTADLKKAEAFISKLQGTIKTLTAEVKTAEEKHKSDLEETKHCSLELATVDHLETANNQAVMYVIGQLRIEVEEQTRINKERDL